MPRQRIILTFADGTQQALELDLRAAHDSDDRNLQVVAARLDGQNRIEGQDYDAGADVIVLQCPRCKQFDEGHECTGST